MAKRKTSSKWKLLTREEEAMVIKDYEKGKIRSRILREYGITSDQFCEIIRRTGVVI